jgi:hypothetical protein
MGSSEGRLTAHGGGVQTGGDARGRDPRGAEYEYLCVDAFLEHVVHARALASAFELGLVDRLAARDGEPLAELRDAFRGDRRGVELLLSLLAATGVVELAAGRVALGQAFRRALRYRDLLEAKLEFAHLALPDVTQLFSLMLGNPEEFRRRARTYGLFSYQHCLEATPENVRRTRQWVRFTTALTRYEGQVVAASHDFTLHRRMLDIGGNSGELALQVCRRHAGMRATVFDLPLVCRIGEEHVRAHPEGDRIAFAAGDALTSPLPREHDVVVFKSVLHDWPEASARELMLRASDALEPGGTLLVFERGPLELLRRPVPYSLLPILVFASAFRTPDLYVRTLTDLGFGHVRVSQIDLEMPFFLVRGIKPGGAGA